MTSRHVVLVLLIASAYGKKLQLLTQPLQRVTVEQSVHVYGNQVSTPRAGANALQNPRRSLLQLQVQPAGL